LPASWTDPRTGDVYDLRGPIIDADGSEWEYVDFDGFEPIVAQHPVDPRYTFAIYDAHDEYGFDAIVTPGPGRPREPDVVLHSPFRRFYELRILTDRTLSQAEQSALGRRYPTAEITPTRLVLDIDGGEVELDEFDDDDPAHGLLIHRIEWPDREALDRLVRDYRFDVALDFYGGGDWSFTVRLPAGDASAETLAPYLMAEADRGGLFVEQVGDDLMVRFTNGETDGHLSYYLKTPDTWLEPLLPIYTDLIRGDLSAAYLGWLKAAEQRRDRDHLTIPPLPLGWHGPTPVLHHLAAFLRLGDWANTLLQNLPAAQSPTSDDPRRAHGRAAQHGG
jgi:hypothetical protein